MFKQHRQIILASGSPRRKSYLERYKLQFSVISADVDEAADRDESPLEYVRRMAREKGENVARRVTEDVIIIAADTIVVLEDQILGKPESKEDVLPMLEQLNGREHFVITSFYVFDTRNLQEVQQEVTTQVIFNQLPKEQLAAYAAVEEPLDKAGAYSIQGIGTFLVRSIVGSYNNVVGLPIEILLQVLIQNSCLSVSQTS